MSRILPVVFIWREAEVADSDTGVVEKTWAMVPLKRYGNVSARQYHEGEEYPLVPLEPRSRASHNAYFAELNRGFDSLPNGPATTPEGKRLKGICADLEITTCPPDGFVDSEHFRKWALCETGFCDITPFDLDSKQDAIKIAKEWRRRDSYCQILVRGAHVTIKEAHSQSASSMGKDPFEKSKHAVLDLLSAMVGVARSELKKYAREAT